MEPVKLASCPVSPDQIRTRSRVTTRAADTEPRGVSRMQFGDEFVYVGTARQWASVTEPANRAGVALRERPGLIDPERLHVVIQKGRLFQREHRDVPVLVDKGRFLLVDLDPKEARRLAKRSEPCFTVRALEALDAADETGQNRVVFEARGRRAADRAGGHPDPAVQTLVDRISRATFEADLASLAALPTRFSTSAHFQTACDLVERQLVSLGYATSQQTIDVNGSRSKNVVARRNGNGPATRGAIMVTAHLDSVNHEGTATSQAPGADDDGSGSAGAIEIARALKDHTGVHDLIFILFGGEEQGMFGSKHFVKSLSAGERSRVRAVVDMDMIGTLNIPVPTVLLEGRALSQAMIDGLAAAASRYTTLAVETSLNAANSDHVSFLDQGIPAVLTIEGADSTNAEIHSERDTLDRINFDMALEILRMNTAFVAKALGAD